MAPKDSTPLLKRLRNLMKDKRYVDDVIHAYIIPTDDAHQSEYVPAHDKRRAFITGFTGSAGTAVVTANEAALWTDGRYWLQAETEMDENWTLMRSFMPDTPSEGEWLNKVLPEGGRVGVDPLLLSAARWKPLQKKLESDGNSLVAINRNLVDAIWEDQPEPPQQPIFIYPKKYSGQSWGDKVEAVRARMTKESATTHAVTALDDIAWLLNLRGSDVLYNPVFVSYVIVTLQKVMFFVDDQKLSDAVREHLESCSCQILPYDTVLQQLENIVLNETGKVWVSNKSSYGIFNAIPKKRRLVLHSPIQELKAVKNETEIKGMRAAHVKDGIAVCQYLYWLEQQLHLGEEVTELSGAQQLEKFRQGQEGYMCDSFETISSVGPNAAKMHYAPDSQSARRITDHEFYLVDSGGQYWEGTTDITRTVHFGNPTDHEKECFTRAIKGHIALARVVFPNGYKGHLLDSLARAPLWDIGLDYMCGTGHGLGVCLNVHEGPCYIGPRYRADEMGLREGMILSNEPGYYEDGNFGVRTESVFLVAKKETKHNFGNKGFLCFENITWAPIQTKLLVHSMLTAEEIEWINSYHEQCSTVLGPLMLEQNQKDLYSWLLRETAQIG